MYIEKEKKIFNTALWVFLIGALAFFIAFISTGRISIKATVWLVLLLLNAGFIIFILLPYPGRKLAGPRRGAHTQKKWYPKNLSDIVEKKEEGPEDRKRKIFSPSRTIEPVPLIPLLLLLVTIIFAMPLRRESEQSREKEVKALVEIFDRSGSAIRDLEEAAISSAETSAGFLAGYDLERIANDEVAKLMTALDSIAVDKGAGLRPFGELGIQIYSMSGKRVAWGGSPRYHGSVLPESEDSVIFTSMTQLYTLLVYEAPLPAGGRVVIDIPLEVNYRISNRFLKNTGIAEMLTVKYGHEVEFRFWMGNDPGGANWKADELLERKPRVVREESGKVRVFGVLRSVFGHRLAILNVSGETYGAAISSKEKKKTMWAGVLLIINVLVLAKWVYHRFAKKLRVGRGEIWNLVRRVAFLTFLLVLIRYILLRTDTPSIFFGINLFDPALFADNLPGGLARTTGDFLITSLFFLILVFGVVKVFRTYYSGYMERKIETGKKTNYLRIAAKAVLLTLILAAAAYLSSRTVSRVILNANPRLLGLDTEFYRVPVLSLHMAMLFSLAGIFITTIFCSRVVLVWGGGNLLEGIPAGIAAIAAMTLLLDPHWSLIAACAALFFLSVRIFPLLRKEEALSLIFTSFFIVLVCSLVVYGIASSEYEGLRRGRVVEKLESFNDPEGNWLMIVLPDLCENITQSRAATAKVLSRKNSTAFELWAESELSRFGFPCVFDVYDARGTRFSRFSMGMPYEVIYALPDTLRVSQVPDVVKITRETEVGKVHFLIGTAPLYHINGISAGYVEIKVPYFFDNPELLVSAGPMAPEIFKNLESGELAPRIDEPEDLLVARISAGRVISSSAPVIASGAALSKKEGEWFKLEADGERYSCLTGYGAEDKGYLVGYREGSLNDRILQWAMVVSINIILTLISLAVLLIIRRLPILGSLTPAVEFSNRLSFRRKLLLSFLAVSVMPVILMGVFSGRYIKYRFRAEGDREALAAVRSAESFIRHSIRSEAEAFAGSQYLGDVLSGEEDPEIRDISRFEGTRFTLFDRDGDILLDENLGDFSGEEIGHLISQSETGMVTLTYSYPFLYGGTVIPVSLPGSPKGFLFYTRRLDDDFIGKIAGVIGQNINIYFDGTIKATSKRELFTGGFLDQLLSPSVYADIGLGGSSTIVRDQTLGNYSYKVANRVLSSISGNIRCVLAVPMLYRTALVRREVLKSYALILGLLALLFSAAVTLGVFLAGKIINPIAALRGGTKRIIKGDLEFMLEAEAQDEIGDLVDSFNTMTTALRGARRDILERQRYLSAILENIGTGVVSTGKDGRIATINPSGERLFGLKGREIIGMKPEEIGQKELAPFMDLFDINSEETIEKEITLLPGENKRIVKAVITRLSAENENLGTVIVFDDLTELIKTKKLSAWVEMARQIAHEVKNPLTPIKLSVQLMQRAYRGDREEFAQIFEEGSETVIRQTEILKKIASEFSSFGKVIDLNPEKIEAGDFIRKILSGYKGADDVEISYTEKDQVAVLADREGLRKIIVNLIENALDAMENGGGLEVGLAREGSMAVISVVDSGIGLSGEIEGKLFEPYFSTKTNGTGLGLAICESLAREMDGEIVIRNRSGIQGVEAIIRIPAAE
ncbi:MAG: PAS domain S-box protein [Candidatus Krumholzibacteriota bacterium]|nr:PAS domain S-box protein [Candidatus Krumholzibacteriota bacterium]